MLKQLFFAWMMVFFPVLNGLATSPFITDVPKKANEFINSIGVNTHFGYANTTYRLYDEILKPKLLELGVKHIRDGTYNEDVLRKYRDIGKHGVKLLLITRASEAVQHAKAIGPMLWGLEAINEPDRRKQAGTWEEQARLEQRQLYRAVRSDAATNHIPIVGIALANIKDNPACLGDISQWMDYGGIHPYAAGQYPSKHWGRGLSMENAISTARLVSKDKPLMVTECGYHNKINNPNHPGVSEKAAAIYQLHMQFVYFNQGIFRSYKYEFLDLNPDPEMTDMECHFGLVRSDGTPKPAFYALKNLLSVLADDDRDFTTLPLSFKIVAPENEKVQYTLLQKSDGNWWLALLRTVNVYNLDNRQDIEIPPVTVQLQLENTPKGIAVYSPNDSDKPVLTEKGRKHYDMELGCGVILIEIKSKN